MSDCDRMISAKASVHPSTGVRLMGVELTSYAEQQAELATKLSAFDGIKLLHIKRQIADLLTLIGRDGFFATYTGHNISHVDEMLAMLDWIVPESTKKAMSAADWLLITLSIYFHDAGMIVTEEEYSRRDQSDFKILKARILSGELGIDYRGKILALGGDKAERFMYQEYVRHKHPERIKNWILGREAEHLGLNRPVMKEIDKLLGASEAQFRADLALVCESHHLDDLNMLSKYPLRQAYGNSDAQTANVQYSAILLRTADLLHITRDRTPSVMFNAINITDPLSQEEWAKQQAVRRVKPRSERDPDGRIDDSLPKHTIEVHATFSVVDGFFGLTSYLSYVGKQLRFSFAWAESSNKKEGVAHQFPWRNIDDSKIIATGFLTQSFEFTVDQGRILDLLTGHTLYNDSTVVLRELAQNSLDAVRLQHQIDKPVNHQARIGSIKVTYKSGTRELTVTDQGTGMTQEIIEKHFLKVGSSRYQDPEFRKSFPLFSAISRFGIGVLSAFMIADVVEVTTCHPDDTSARHLTLRSVHGKYLIRLLDKTSDPMVKGLIPHGTSMKLTLRASVKDPEVIQVMRNWVVFPGCPVTVKVDDHAETAIGYDSPKSALESAIAASFDGPQGLKSKYKVEEIDLDGTTFAFALKWSEYFHEWSFLTLPNPTPDANGQRVLSGLGMCVGGVRVEATPPGFNGFSIAAIANATGPNAPRTNVARSRLESTEQWERGVQAIYRSLCAHVTAEVARMQSENAHSLTWAAQEAPYLIRTLTDQNNATHPKILSAEIATIPALIVEVDGRRVAMSADELCKADLFWTIDCAFFLHAEWLIREVQTDASLSGLINSLKAKELQLPKEPVLCSLSPSNPLVKKIMEEREVDFIRILPDQRRVDLRWVRPLDPKGRWRHLELDRPLNQNLARALQIVHQIQPIFRRGEATQHPLSLRVAAAPMNPENSGGYHAVTVESTTYLFEPVELTNVMTRLLDRAEDPGGDTEIGDALLALTVITAAINASEAIDMHRVLRTVEEHSGLRPSEGFPRDDLAAMLAANRLKSFDAKAWRRG
jgi:molecular chaperone HtpG